MLLLEKLNLVINTLNTMAAYITQSEVRSLWESSVKTLLRKCRSDRKIPEGLVELIKHNFYAKYVYYNPEQEYIEIGVNESKQRAVSYPTIRVYCFSVDEVEDRLLASFQSNRVDLEFYAKILQGKNLNSSLHVL